jgi:ureidoacrylate peracid hydrolase
MPLSPHCALIVVDMQNGFCHDDGFMHTVGLDHTTSMAAVGPVSRLVTAARAAEVPIFFIVYELNADYSDAGLLVERRPAIVAAKGMIRGTWDAQIVDELTPSPGDRVISKTRHAALGTDTVIVCGVTTNVCVASTVRDAYFRDFRVSVPSDATAAVTPAFHDGALADVEYSYGTVTSVAELETELAQLRDR